MKIPQKYRDWKIWVRFFIIAAVVSFGSRFTSDLLFFLSGNVRSVLAIFIWIAIVNIFLDKMWEAVR